MGIKKIGAVLVAAAVLALVWASPASATEPERTITVVLWEKPVDAFGPQTLVTSQADTGSLDVFDGRFECGKAYQVDRYFDGDTTAALIAGGVLSAPNNPVEDLVPGGDGVAYKTVITEACPPVEEPPVEEPPAAVPPVTVGSPVVPATPVVDIEPPVESLAYTGPNDVVLGLLPFALLFSILGGGTIIGSMIARRRRG